MAGEWKNRLGNAVATPVRMGLGAPGYAAIDLAKTGIALGKDAKEVAMNTANDIQELFQEAGKRGKMHHKAANLVLATGLSVGKVGEGIVRGVVNPLVNGVVNTFNTAKGFIKNERRGLTSVFSKKPISDFSFEHLKTRAVSKNWDFTKLLLKGTPKAPAAPAPGNEVVPMQAPVAKMDEASQKTIADLTAKATQQDKLLQQANQDVEAMKKAMQEQTKLMQEQAQKQNELMAMLKAKDTSDIAQDTPKDPESSKKKILEKS